MPNAPRPCVRVIPGPASVRSLCLAVVALVLAATTSTAAPWRATGVAVDSAATGQGTLRAVSDGRGGLIAAWVDTLSGSPDLRCQRIDSTGTTQWTANGVLVRSNALGISGLAIAPDGANGVLLAWVDGATVAQTKIRVQHLNSAGAAQWTAGGVVLTSLATSDTLQVTPSVDSDGSGGALVAWSEQRTPGNAADVYAQRVQSSGALGWGTGGVLMSVSTGVDADNQVNPHVLSDGVDGAYVSWEHLHGTTDTYFERLDGSGNTVWPQPYLPANSSQSRFAAMARLPGGDLGISWTSSSVLRGARLAAADGTTLADPTVASGLSTTMSSFGLVAKSNNEALLGYTNGTDDMRVVLLGTNGLVSSNGAARDSIALRPLDATSSPTLVPDGADGAYAVWASGGLVRAQHIGPSATRLWAAPATLTAGASPVQSYPVAGGGAFDLVAAWIDGRNAAGATGPDVYAQRVSPSGVAGAYYRVLATVAGGSGSLSPAAGRTWVVAGDSLRVRLTSSGGSHVDHLVVGATNLGAVPNYTFHAVKGDSTLSAYFAAGTVSGTIPVAANVYASFTIPGTLSLDTPAAAFANLMPYDDTKWRLGHWRADLASYVEPGSGLDHVVPGAGYWFLLPRDTTLAFTGSPVAEAEYSIALVGAPGSTRGWTQFGSPFRFPVAVSQLKLSQGPGVAITDPSNALTDHQVLAYDPSVPGTDPYRAAAVLHPGRAYWIWRDSTAGALNLRVPFEWNPNALRDTVPPGPNALWSLGVTAVAGTRASRIELGTALVAAGVRNPLSAHALPAGPGAEVSLVAHVPEWGGADESFRSVYRPDAADVAWDLDASAAAGLTQAELAFDLAGLPSGRRVVLSEPAAGWSREVTAGERVPLALSSTPRRLRLEVVTGTGALPVTPPATALRAAGPNPFRDATTLSFSLAHGGPLRWDVFDLAGRRVVSDTRTLAAGEHVVTWDGRDAAGRRLEPGLYLLRWQADGRSGTARLVRTE